jgi:hypothetical protein
LALKLGIDMPSMKCGRNPGALFLLSTVGIVALCVVALGALSHQSQPRIMAHRYGVPLSKQVSCEKGETILFPRELHDSVFDREPTAEEYANWIIEVAHIAIVMVVDKATSSVIDNDSWMSTRLSGFIEEVLLAKKRKRMELSPPTIEIPDAGEMMINDCHVIAGNYPTIVPGQRYLLFLQEDDAASRTVITVIPPIRIGENGDLSSPVVKWLHGASLEMVRQRIRLVIR